jgi:hypothetical protein
MLERDHGLDRKAWKSEVRCAADYVWRNEEEAGEGGEGASERGEARGWAR